MSSLFDVHVKAHVQVSKMTESHKLRAIKSIAKTLADCKVQSPFYRLAVLAPNRICLQFIHHVGLQPDHQLKAASLTLGQCGKHSLQSIEHSQLGCSHALAFPSQRWSPIVFVKGKCRPRRLDRITTQEVHEAARYESSIVWDVVYGCYDGFEIRCCDLHD